ncbi:hypothetical protein ACIPLR_13655 [Herbaspirillum huttiense]|uniref:hypothetical protein n=1 Tax=Herbaspirillum huttiense TaxID=863372 RepID=UPI00381E2061
MTNYINEEILCEAYTKLDIDLFHDKEKLKLLEKSLKDFFEERAKFYLGNDAKIKIEFEEGSLITKLTVIGGAVTAIASGIAQYGSFRDSVAQIAEDATMLAQSANSEVIFRTRTQYCNRLDSERRKGIFGRADDLIKRLDSIHDRIANSKLPTSLNALKAFNSANDDLAKWDLTADKFFNKLTDGPTIACLSAGLLEELEKLPESVIWENDLKKATFRSTIANSNPKLAGEIAGAAARYAATLNAIKRSNRTSLRNLFSQSMLD